MAMEPTFTTWSVIELDLPRARRTLYEKPSHARRLVFKLIILINTSLLWIFVSEHDDLENESTGYAYSFFIPILGEC